MTRRRTSPEAAEKIVAHAHEYLECPDCGVGVGLPCIKPGRGHSVCRGRYIAAAIQMKRTLKAAARTLEQQEILANLPRVPRAEIEAGRSPRGGWTKKQLAEWGVPWPPPTGWLAALLRGEDGMARDTTNSSVESTTNSSTTERTTTS